MSGEMAVAYWAAHVPNGWSKAGTMGLIPYNNNGNLAILYCFVFLYIAVAGGGPLEHRRPAPGAVPAACRSLVSLWVRGIHPH